MKKNPTDMSKKKNKSKRTDLTAAAGQVTTEQSKSTIAVSQPAGEESITNTAVSAGSNTGASLSASGERDDRIAAEKEDSHNDAAKTTVCPLNDKIEVISVAELLRERDEQDLQALNESLRKSVREQTEVDQVAAVLSQSPVASLSKQGGNMEDADNGTKEKTSGSDDQQEEHARLFEIVMEAQTSFAEETERAKRASHAKDDLTPGAPIDDSGGAEQQRERVKRAAVPSRAEKDTTNAVDGDRVVEHDRNIIGIKQSEAKTYLQPVQKPVPDGCEPKKADRTAVKRSISDLEASRLQPTDPRQQCSLEVQSDEDDDLPPLNLTESRREQEGDERENVQEEQDKLNDDDSSDEVEENAPRLLAWPRGNNDVRPLVVDPAVFCGGATTAGGSGASGARSSSGGAAHLSPLERALQAATGTGAEQRFDSIAIGSFFGFSLVFVLQPSGAYLREQEKERYSLQCAPREEAEESEEEVVRRFVAPPERCQATLADHGALIYWQHLLRKHGDKMADLCAKESDFCRLVEALERLAAAVPADLLESLHFDSTTGRFHLWISEPVFLSDPSPTSAAYEAFERRRDAGVACAARRERALYYIDKRLNLGESDVALLRDALLDDPLRQVCSVFLPRKPLFRNVGDDDPNCAWSNMIVAPCCNLARDLASPKVSLPPKKMGGGKRKKQDSSSSTASFLHLIQMQARPRLSEHSTEPSVLRMWQSIAERLFAVDASARLRAQYGVASVAGWITGPPMRGCIEPSARPARRFDINHCLRLAVPDSHLRNTIVGWLVSRQRTIEYLNGFVGQLRSGGFVLQRAVAEAEHAAIVTVKKACEAALLLENVSMWTLDWTALIAAVHNNADLEKNGADLVVKHRKAYKGAFNYWRAAGETACRVYDSLYFRPRPSAGLARALPWLAAPFAKEQCSADREFQRGHLNRWTGHSIEYEQVAHLYAPRQPRGRWLAPIAAYLWHVYRHIAGARLADFAYLLRWFACSLQEPYARRKQALLLMGLPGAGKGIFFKAQMDIVGSNHSVQLGRAEHDLLGQFNPLLKDRTLVFADEFREPDKPGPRAILKGLITEGTYTDRNLFTPAAAESSYIGLVMASNERKPVQLDRNARRYFVQQVEPVSVEHPVTQQLLLRHRASLSPQEQQQQQQQQLQEQSEANISVVRQMTESFYTLVAQHECAAYGALGVRVLATLEYRADLRQHNRHAPAPHTPALTRLIEESMDLTDQWWYRTLYRGYHVRTMLSPEEQLALAYRRQEAVTECHARRTDALGPTPDASARDPASVERYKRFYIEQNALPAMAEGDVPPVNVWTTGWLDSVPSVMLFRNFARYVNSNSGGGGGGGDSDGDLSKPRGVAHVDENDTNGKAIQNFLSDFQSRYLSVDGSAKFERMTVKVWTSTPTGAVYRRGFKMPSLQHCRNVFRQRFNCVSFGDDDLAGVAGVVDDCSCSSSNSSSSSGYSSNGSSGAIKKQRIMAPEMYFTPTPTDRGGYLSVVEPGNSNSSEPEEEIGEEPPLACDDATPEERAPIDYASVEEFLERGVLGTIWPADAGDDPLFAGVDGEKERWRRVLRDLGLTCECGAWRTGLADVLEAAHQLSQSEVVCVPLSARTLTWAPGANRDEQCALLRCCMADSAAVAEEIVAACEAAVLQWSQPILLVCYPGPEIVIFGEPTLASRAPTVHIAAWAHTAEPHEQPTFAVLQRVEVN